jgi:hypothetical protein
VAQPGPRIELVLVGHMGVSAGGGVSYKIGRVIVIWCAQYSRHSPLERLYINVACAIVNLRFLLMRLQGGTCSRGDACPFAHSMYEYWLHPGR